LFTDSFDVYICINIINMKKLSSYKETLESLYSEISQTIEKLTTSENKILYNTEVRLDELSERLSENDLYLTLKHIPRGLGDAHVYQLRLYDRNINSPLETVMIKYFPAREPEQTNKRRRSDDYGKKWHKYLKDIAGT